MKKYTRAIAAVLIPPILYLLMRFIWFTSRKSFHFVTPISDAQHICVCWHSELLMSPQAYRKIHKQQKSSAIISQHFDGALIAKTLNYLRIRPLRGSSSKGAQRVLLQAFRQVKEGDEVLITPDGPRGPRYSMSDGAIGLALRSHLPIFVMNYKPESFWKLKSWDSFIIPKPFGKIDFYLQSLSLDSMDLDEAKVYLKEKMLANALP
jgi:hypothetical protein